MCQHKMYYKVKYGSLPNYNFNCIDKLRGFQHKHNYRIGQYSTLAGIHGAALKEMHACMYKDQRLTHYYVY